MLFAPIRVNAVARTFQGRYWDNTMKRSSQSLGTLRLTHGGVYDNLGSEPLLSARDPFLVVDASKFAEQWYPRTRPSYFARTRRPLKTGLDQVVSLRRRLLYEHALRVGGLLLILRDPIAMLAGENRHGRFESDAPAPLDNIPELDNDVQELLASLRTDLDMFSEIEIACLMWAGAARMDIAIRRYVAKQLPPTSHSPPVLRNVSPSDLRVELRAGQTRSYFGRA